MDASAAGLEGADDVLGLFKKIQGGAPKGRGGRRRTVLRTMEIKKEKK